MDMYETAQEIRRLTRDRKYREVVKIADRLNLGKITSGMMVLDIVEAYENQGDRKAARDALLAYYDSHGITGRNMMQKLIELCVETGDINNAVSLCLQFENSWPDSSISYLMRYQITAAAGGSYEEQITYLEKYREVEFEERWGYELAKLYERNNERDKCTRICHDLICYFGHGKYVDKAARLKSKICGLTDDEERAIAESFSKEAEEIQAKEEAARNVQLAGISAPTGSNPEETEPAAATNDSAENDIAADADQSVKNPSEQENEAETTLSSVPEQNSDSTEKTSEAIIEAKMKEAADEKLRLTEEAARKRREEQARAEAARQAEIARQAAEKARKEEAIRKEKAREEAVRTAAGVTGEQDNAAGENPESVPAKADLFDSQNDYLEPYSADEDRYSQVDRYREKEIKVTSITRSREQKKPEPVKKPRKSGGFFGSFSRMTSGIRQSFQADDGDIDTITEDDSDDNVEYITVGRESQAYEEDINERILDELDMLDEEQIAELSEDEIKEIYELKMHRNLRENIARMIRESEIGDMPGESALSDFVEANPYENDVFEEVPDAEFTETEEIAGTDSDMISETEEADADAIPENMNADTDVIPENVKAGTVVIPENVKADTVVATENAEADAYLSSENAESDTDALSENAESDSNVTPGNAEAVDNIMNFIGRYVSESDTGVKKSAVQEEAVFGEESNDESVCDAKYEPCEDSDAFEMTATEQTPGASGSVQTQSGASGSVQAQSGASENSDTESGLSGEDSHERVQTSESGQPAGSSGNSVGSEASSESGRPAEPEKTAEPDILDSIEDPDETMSISKFRECILAFAHRRGYEVEESSYLTISALAEQMQEDGTPLSVHNAEKMTDLAIARSQKKGPLDKLIGKYSKNYAAILKDRHFYWKK